jgi:preprotein translocase subunit YajC
MMNILLQAAPAAQPSPWGSQLFLLGGLLIIMYFFMIRPQMKRAKEAKKFREGIQKGDKVVTIGGLHGQVLEVSDTTVLISVESGKIRVEKNALSPSAQASEQEVGQRAR